MLEVVGVSIDDPLLAAWRARVERAAARLGWRHPQTIVRRHSTGASLAIAAPCDQLFLATEVNEWALCAALIERDPVRWSNLEQALVAAAMTAAENAANPAANLQPVIEEPAALERFERLAALEANPKLRALLEVAATRELPHVLDDSELTLGAGVGGRSLRAHRPAARRRRTLGATARHPDGHGHGVERQDHYGAARGRVRPGQRLARRLQLHRRRISR